MYKLLVGSLLLLAISCSTPIPNTAPSIATDARALVGQVVKIRPAIQYQTITGWGTCLAW